MKNMKAGSYLLHVPTDSICILWSVSPLQIANLDTLEMLTPSKRDLQEFIQVNASIVYEIK